MRHGDWDYRTRVCDHARSQRHNDAGADGGAREVVWYAIGQQIELRDWNSDAYQQLRTRCRMTLSTTEDTEENLIFSSGLSLHILRVHRGW